MMNTLTAQPTLAPSITKAASKQTYYTVRFLVDRERVADAYKAYAYFRWVDDTLDDPALPTLAPGASAGESTGTTLAPHASAGVVSGAIVGRVAPHALCGAYRDQGNAIEAPERMAFLERQKTLLEKCYHGESLSDATPEEQMLIELIKHDSEKNSGLQSYLRNMMHVMEFDAKRRGRLISQAELSEYTRWLATAVTEAMHYFIGHCCFSPHDETRYLAVAGAHITHMLRDTFDDVQAGYYNIPREVLESNHIQPQDVNSKAYRAWVQGRVLLARKYFQAGRGYLARVANPRCRLAGLAYTARFEWLLDTLEQEGYLLRPEYSERKSLGTGLRMGLNILASVLGARGAQPLPQPVISQPLRKL